MVPTLKVVIIGDNGVGKSSLLVTASTKQFCEKLENIEDLTSKITIDKEIYIIDPIDTIFHEYKCDLNCSEFYGANAFIFAFSIDNVKSFENIKTKWIPEFKKHFEDIPFILVGTQSDLRNDSSITNQNGEDLKKEIGAYTYIECSSKNQEKIQEVFQEVIRSTKDSSSKSKQISFDQFSSGFEFFGKIGDFLQKKMEGSLKKGKGWAKTILFLLAVIFIINGFILYFGTLYHSLRPKGLIQVNKIYGFEENPHLQRCLGFLLILAGIANFLPWMYRKEGHIFIFLAFVLNFLIIIHYVLETLVFFSLRFEIMFLFAVLIILNAGWSFVIKFMTSGIEIPSMKKKE